MRTSRVIAVTALLAGMALVLAAPATGHGVRYARSLSGGFIPDTGPPFSAVTGKLSSGKPACRRGKVKLLRVQPGPDAVVGARFTTRQGFFTIPAPGGQFSDGAYYLQVRKKVLLRGDRFHRHFCPRLQTNAFPITNP